MRIDDPAALRKRAKLRDSRITLAHGAGGKAMRDLIGDVFVSAFANPWLESLEDQARFDIRGLAAQGERLAFTTDSYVIDPLFFPGGDIGMLAVNGTVNDLAVSGARPLYLSCGVIVEEGFEIDKLRDIAFSMASAARAADVAIATGDTKVVPRGATDKLFINTSGIGVIAAGVDIAATRACAGDAIIVNGTIGDHGAAILTARQDLGLSARIMSDSQPIAGLVQAMLAVCSDIHCLRDATRGGVATVLNEIAASSNVCMRIDETRVPLSQPVKAVCELLGLDPLYLANEGKLVAIVPHASAEIVLAAMRSQPAGAEAAIIGEVVPLPEAMVVLVTAFGGERVVDMLVGEQLPRIC